MRTRGNGQPLSESGILEDAIQLGLDDKVTPSAYFELAKDLASLIGRERQIAFDEGMKLGARVENRTAVQALQQAALTVLGKDRGDGAIDLGALGSDVYKEA